MTSDAPSEDRLTVGVHIQDQSWTIIPALEERVIDIVRCTFADVRLRPYLKKAQGTLDLAVVLVSDQEIQSLNATYRKKDKPTNVLSFPQDELDPKSHELPETIEGACMLGDIFVAYETVMKESQEQEKQPIDHVCHLVVHGVLHLLGYDHIVDDEAEEMEALEVAILAQRGISDPYGSLEIEAIDVE